MNKKLNLITIAAIVMICATTIITIVLLANADTAFGRAMNSIVTLYPGESLTVICDGETMPMEYIDDLTALISCEGNAVLGVR